MQFKIPVPEGRSAADPEVAAYRERWRANNARWLTTTIAKHAAKGPRISYQEVDTSVLEPAEPRDYR